MLLVQEKQLISRSFRNMPDINLKKYNHIKSFLLVGVQFICIFYLLVAGDYGEFDFTAAIFLVAAMILIFWSLLSMRKSKLRVFPTPAQDAVLITNGPYRWVRHPMYSSLLMGGTGLLIDQFSLDRFLIFLLLAIVLHFKMSWEEKMLQLKFSSYHQYMKSSYRLFPFIY